MAVTKARGVIPTEVIAFHEYLRQATAELFPCPGQPVAVAVSGGADSTALLYGLAALAQWPLRVLHVDHGLRRESAAEAIWLQHRCRELRQSGVAVECLLKHVDLAGEAPGMGLEEAGRHLRYAWFAEIAQQQGCRVVATAHHRDDQVETVLAHILRGSGPVGMAGIPPRRWLAADIALVRPLLTASHQQCLAYLRSRGVTWCEDNSNYDTAFRRNYLRHEVIPTLNAGAPGLSEELLALAKRYRRQLTHDQQQVAALMEECLQDDRCYLPPLLAVSPQLRFLCWRHLVQAVAIPLERRVLKQLETLATAPSHQQWQIKGLSFRRRGAYLQWEAWSCATDTWSQPVVVPGQTSLPHGLLCARFADVPKALHSKPHSAYLDWRQLHGALQLRNSQAGERWRALGAPGSRPLWRWLSDHGVGTYARRRQLVVADAQGVVWIPGHTIAHRARITAATTEVLQLSVRVNNDRD